MRIFCLLILSFPFLAFADSDPVTPVQCNAKDGSISAMGTFSGPTDGSGNGWLQLTVVSGGKTYLISELAKMTSATKWNTVESANVDDKGRPLVHLGADNNSYVTSGAVKVKLQSCW